MLILLLIQNLRGAMAEDLFAFGAWVRLRRQALVLTREDLAGRVGCAEVTIRKIESDERKPSPQVAELLAQHLGLSVEQRDLFVRVARGVLPVAQLPQAIPGAPVASVPIPSNQPPAATLPSGTVTFLFTDIEGSTRRWEEQPDAMRQSLARHDAILRAAIESYGGQVFKTVGDAFCAAFASAPDALRAAIDGQRTLVGENWGTIGPIRVRMALHTGTAVPQAGDYFGQPLNRVARILAAGHGRQILLSLATHELVRDHLPDGASLRDLGSHRLKDLLRPEPIFQFDLLDLPTDFPPLRTLDARSTNLPAQANALIGRTHEIAEVSALLGETRLVTLTGPGGTGKTRLALQTATGLLDQYADGVWFIDLSPISDPEQIANTIAQTLALPEVPGQSVRATVISWLRARHTLLLLDNCEQVIDGVADLAADLLRSAPRLSLLATSRIPLRLAAEQEYPVAPLALPDPGALPALDHLSQYEAVALFITRARAVRPTFSITNANAPAVAEICVRLDGLPLAIELAAARVRLYPPEQLLVRLTSDRLQTLTGGARDLPTRQQTIRNTIDWSYRLLIPAQQQVFARLGVFVGGWTADAAAALGDDDPVAVAEGLELLIEQSLVRMIETGAEPRYTMLETIRAYALECLAASGVADAARRQHAAHYLALAEMAQTHLHGRERGAWLERLEMEHDNLRAALAWALDSGDREIGARIAIALVGQDGDGLWGRTAYWHEGLRWFEAMLAQRDALTPGILAWVLLLAAAFQGMLDGNPYLAQRLVADEALALFHTASDQSGIAYARLSQGHTEEALARYQNLGDHYHCAIVLNEIGRGFLAQDDIPQVLALFEQSLTLCREHDYIGQTAIALNGLGDAACLTDDIPRATACYWEALSLAKAARDDARSAWLVGNLARLALVQGDDGRVLTLLQQQVAQLRQSAALSVLVMILPALGALVNAQGDSAQARAILREALLLQQQFAPHNVYGEFLDSLEACAGVAVGQGQAVQAARLLGAAEVLHRTKGVQMLPSARPAYRRAVAAARAHLADEVFAAAWAAGQALTLEQAIAEALAELQRTDLSTATG
jgi:predicted ATPase/class 3 adenylate cyclase/tetratricopeptide (TPR) repeat protein